jgi:hypothetical protein
VSWINLPDGLTILCVAPTVLPESRGPVRDRPFDLAGAVTVTLAMVLLMYAVAELTLDGDAVRAGGRGDDGEHGGRRPDESAAGDPVRRTPGGRRGDDPARRRYSPGCRMGSAALVLTALPGFGADMGAALTLLTRHPERPREKRREFERSGV